MNRILTILALILVGSSCSRTNLNDCQQEVFRGKLLLKGICMNYVIQLVDGELDENLYEKQWEYPNSGEVYSNVFALGSVCSFPDYIQEGEEFNFILKKETQGCAVCEAYSPTPNKAISIKVCN